MRKLEVVAEVACGGLVGSRGTRAGRKLAVPASEADASGRLTQNRFRHPLLRQS